MVGAYYHTIPTQDSTAKCAAANAIHEHSGSAEWLSTITMASMRVQQCLMRSSSLIRRGTTSSRSLLRNHPNRIICPAAHRALVGQGRDVSTSTSSSLHLPLPLQRHGSRCTGAGGSANGLFYAYGTGFNSYNSCIRSSNDGWLVNHQTHRAFSSIDGSAESDPSSLNQKIISLAESDDVKKAEELLKQMQTNAISQNQQDGLPDIDSYTAVINALLDEQKRLLSAIEVETNEIVSDANATMPNEQCAESNEKGAETIMALAEKAHDLLIQMEDLSGVSDHYSSMRPSGIMGGDLRDETLRPDSHHYDSVILAFANAATAAHDAKYNSHMAKNAPFISQQWLQRMETLAFDSHSGVRPTVDSYFHVMEAYAATENATTVPKKQSKAPVLVQSIFDKLKQNTTIVPTVREYRLLLRTWCSSGMKEAAYNSFRLWMTMQKEFQDGAEEMEPTLEDGKMVLEMWARSKNKNSARRAQTILSTMEYLHSSKKSKVRPDLDCYRYVLTTLSHSRAPDVGKSIPKLFNSMESNQLFPDTACFDAAIEALANCSRYAKSEESITYSKAAEAMLQKMEKERDRSSVGEIIKPSAVTYTNMIQALAVRKTKKAAVKAEALLNRMIEGYAAGDESMRPTRDSYVGTIRAYGVSGPEDNFVLANEVFQRMLADFSQGNEAAHPDFLSFHAVLRACMRASSTSQSAVRHKEALLLAISTVQHMKKSPELKCSPYPKTYELLLQCCTNLLPQGVERERALRSIFRSCCNDGLVNKKVLSAFQSAVSTDAYHKEVVRDAPSYNGIKSVPENWTRNLGYRARTHGDGASSGKRNPIVSVTGEKIASTAYSDHRMRRRWEKKNQKLLQGGRT